MTERILVGADLERERSAVQEQDLDDEDALTPAADLAMRQEPFGGSVFHGNKCLFIKYDPFALLKQAVTSVPLTINGVASKIMCDKRDLRSFFRVLIDDGFLERAPGGGETGERD